ncbi:MAG: hypothetical protein AMXMBFR7_47260 [Planctomycetota bacterium]
MGFAQPFPPIRLPGRKAFTGFGALRMDDGIQRLGDVRAFLGMLIRLFGECEEIEEQSNFIERTAMH